jgi:FAD:protein FMN transferase
MRTNGQIEIRRCRPLLGTFVEIQAFGTKAAELEDAVEAAFLAIAHVQRLMSFHDPESEVSRMNRDACYKLVRVHP